MSDTKTLIELIDEYAETRHRCGCATYNAKTEAARKAVIEALSGVQALSAELGASRAAPPSAYVDGAGIHAEDGASAVIRKLDARFHDIATFKAAGAAAASPTPPAERQATTTEAGATTGAALGVEPGAVYAELRHDEVGRAVDVVVERCISLTKDASGIKVVYNPIILADALRAVLRDFADRTHALRMEQAATKAAPVVWLSSKQLRGVTALHGQYLPFRCQPEGRFDTPVYLAEAAPKAAPGEPSDAEIDEFIDLHCWDANGRRSIVRHAIARWGAAPTTRPAPQQEAPLMPKGESAASKLRAMAANYHEGHLWDKLDSQACAQGAMEIEVLRQAPQQEPASPIRVGWGRDYQDGGKPIDASAAPVPDFAAILQQEAQEPGEIDRLRAALVYTAFALHGTPQYMLADGITLIDGDTVQVSRDGWKVQASANPLRQSAQPAPAPLSDDVVRDAAFEAVRKKLCALPRFSFLSDGYGVRRAPDKSGSWIAFDAAHELFDPVAVDAALAAQGGK